MGSLAAHRQVGDTDAGKFQSDGPVSPHSRAELIHNVTQVIHSELDYRLPISEGLAMFNVLQARGVPSKLVMFPDENHVSTESAGEVGRIPMAC